VWTSVGRVFDFCNPGRFWVFEKKSEPKNHWFWVFENFQNQRTVGFGYLKRCQTQRTASSGYFKNFKKLLGFMKELANGYEIT
jgi:hypothetical protein